MAVPLRRPALPWRRRTLSAVLGLAALLLVGPALASTTGPDVASYQHPGGSQIDWGAVAGSGQRFAFVKATEGDYYTNPYFSTDTAGMRSAGLLHGAYHFADPSGDPVAEARYFIGVTGTLRNPGDLPPALDLETSGGLAPDALVAWTHAFLDTVEGLTGRVPIIYTGPYFWRSALGDSHEFTRYPLWVAHYTSDPAPMLMGGWTSWTFWQFTSSAAVPGIPGNADQSRFCCDDRTLAALSHATPDPSAVAPRASVSVGGPGAGGVAVTVHADPANSWLTSRYTFQVDSGNGFVPFGDRSFTSPGVLRPDATASLITLPGRSYTVRALIYDAWGRAVSTTPAQTFTAPATTFTPHSLESMSATGELGGVGMPPVAPAAWNFPITRALLSQPGAAGAGWIVDAWGGIHAFGGAPALTASAYYPQWDIVRGAALNADGAGGYVLDGWGGLHPIGNAAPVAVSQYWPGWDIARAVVTLPTSSVTNPAGYVLDGWGGVHPFGSAPPLDNSFYQPGWDIARSLTLDPSGQGGYLLDGWGGVHNLGTAAPVVGNTYWPGWDIARGVAASPDGHGGWVLDGYGGVHPFSGAPTLPASTYWGVDTARALAVAR